MSWAYHFSKYAANAPDVHRCGVILRPEEELGGSVPQGYHLCYREEDKEGGGMEKGRKGKRVRREEGWRREGRGRG